MQGATGSGKTTLANRLVEAWGNCILASTDHWFVMDHMRETGEPGGYLFDASKLGEYHARTQELARNALAAGLSVVVDNTNIRAWEARPYVEAAVKLGVPVVFVRCEGRFQSTHGVPPERVEAMRNALEPLSVATCMNAVRPPA